MYRRHELLESKLCKELDLLEEKYRTGAEMSEGDLRRIDLLAHSIASLTKYAALKEAEETRGYNGQSSMSSNSYANSYTNSYANSYQNAYPAREAIDKMMSRDNGGMSSYFNGGGMPYPQDRRW